MYKEHNNKVGSFSVCWKTLENNMMGSQLSILSSRSCEGPESFMTFPKETLNSCSHEADIFEKGTQGLILSVTNHSTHYSSNPTTGLLLKLGRCFGRCGTLNVDMGSRGQLSVKLGP